MVHRNIGKKVRKIVIEGIPYLFSKNQRKRLEKLDKLDQILTGKKKRDNQIKIATILRKGNAFHSHVIVRTRQIDSDKSHFK